MKETELRKHADCSVCEKPIGASRSPLFWRMTLERFGAMLESMRLAQVMGTDDDMAVPMQEPVVVTVCETCAAKPVSVYELGLKS